MASRARRRREATYTVTKHDLPADMVKRSFHNGKKSDFFKGKTLKVGDKFPGPKPCTITKMTLGVNPVKGIKVKV